MKRILLASLALLPLVASAEVSIKILPNVVYPNQAIPTQQIIELVRKNIDLSSAAKLYSVNVQTIYDA